MTSLNTASERRRGPWVIEIDTGGINWTPIASCSSRPQAERLAEAPHIVDFGKPVRVRELWHPATEPR